MFINLELLQKCPVCEGDWQNVVTLGCGHLICDVCLKRCIKDQGRSARTVHCQFCHNPTVIKNICKPFPIAFVLRKIYQIYCLMLQVSKVSEISCKEKQQLSPLEQPQFVLPTELPPLYTAEDNRRGSLTFPMHASNYPTGHNDFSSRCTVSGPYVSYSLNGSNDFPERRSSVPSAPPEPQSELVVEKEFVIKISGRQPTGDIEGLVVFKDKYVVLFPDHHRCVCMGPKDNKLVPWYHGLMPYPFRDAKDAVNFKVNPGKQRLLLVSSNPDYGLMSFDERGKFSCKAPPPRRPGSKYHLQDQGYHAVAYENNRIFALNTQTKTVACFKYNANEFNPFYPYLSFHISDKLLDGEKHDMVALGEILYIQSGSDVYRYNINGTRLESISLQHEISPEYVSVSKLTILNRATLLFVHTRGFLAYNVLSGHFSHLQSDASDRILPVHATVAEDKILLLRKSADSLYRLAFYSMRG